LRSRPLVRPASALSRRPHVQGRVDRARSRVAQFPLGDAASLSTRRWAPRKAFFWPLRTSVFAQSGRINPMWTSYMTPWQIVNHSMRPLPTRAPHLGSPTSGRTEMHVARLLTTYVHNSCARRARFGRSGGQVTTAVAKRSDTCLLTYAKGLRGRFGRLIADRRKGCTAMRAVTEGLRLAQTARTPPVSLARFHQQFDGPHLRNFCSHRTKPSFLLITMLVSKSITLTKVEVNR